MQAESDLKRITLNFLIHKYFHISGCMDRISSFTNVVNGKR